MKIFLSYSKHDSEKAMIIRNYLANNNFEVFDINSEITVGDDLNKILKDYIEKSDIYIILISRKSIKSNFVNKEISIAISKKSNNNSYMIIPVVLEKNVDIPFFLKDISYLDISETKNIQNSLESIVYDIKNRKSEVPLTLEEKFFQIEKERELLNLEIIEAERIKNYRLTRISFIISILTILGSTLTIFSISTISINNFVISIFKNPYATSITAFILGMLTAIVITHMKRIIKRKSEFKNKTEIKSEGSNG